VLTRSDPRSRTESQNRGRLPQQDDALHAGQGVPQSLRAASCLVCRVCSWSTALRAKSCTGIEHNRPARSDQAALREAPPTVAWLYRGLYGSRPLFLKVTTWKSNLIRIAIFDIREKNCHIRCSAD